MKYITKLKEHYKQLFVIQHEPWRIALGAAVGAFIDVLPTFVGLSILFAALALLIYPKLSKIGMAAAMVFWNPLLTFPLYGFSFVFSNTFYPEVTATSTVGIFWQEFFVGNLIIAFGAGLVTFGLVYSIATFTRYKKRQREKIKKRKK